LSAVAMSNSSYQPMWPIRKIAFFRLALTAGDRDPVAGPGAPASARRDSSPSGHAARP
jgi:hypothetical protein